MLKTSTELLTANDYRAMPEGPPYFQLVEGKLYMSPSPNFFHQSVAGNIYFLLRGYLKRHPRGKVAIAPSDVQLDFVNVHQPDVYFVSNERLDIIQEQGPVGAPDLVIEVLSRSTARLDKGPKLRVYARSGVRELWLVDKDKKQVAVYRFEKNIEAPVAILSGKQKLATPLLPGLSLPLTKVFEA
jgi:Uma2 family endonuclease